MTRRPFVLLLAAFALVPAVGARAAAPADGPDFHKEVLPILKQHCFACHSGATNQPKGKLRLDRKADLEERVDAADPDASDILHRALLGQNAKRLMPPEGFGPRLGDREIEVLRAWMKTGASFGGNWTEYKHLRYQDFEPAPKRPVDLDAAARRVDELVEAKLKEAGQRPNADVDDATFLRRAYLQAAGRIPTPAEAERFLASTDPHRRAKLIDELVGSEAYVSTMFNHWADALRAKSDLDHGRSGDLYLWWIKDAVRRNVPYDQFVRRLLLAEGNLWDDPAVAFYFRDAGNRLATVEATASVFLGTNIGCAQCHNDPFDVWTRRDYWEFAAFFAPASPYFPREQTFAHIKWDDVERQRNDLRVENERQRRSWASHEVDVATTSWTVNQKLLGRIVRNDKVYPALPHDYQYADGKPKEVVRPQVLFGARRDVPNSGAAIDALADWIASPRNPRFTLTVVNRLWAHALGAPLAGKVTDVVPIEESPNPELARFLVQTMIDLDYDVQRFQRLVLRTRTWQRAASAEPVLPHRPYLFPGPVLRRMSAEQAWDSLLALAVPNVEATVRKAGPDYSFYARIQRARSTEEYWQLIEELIASGGGYKASFTGGLKMAGEVRAVGFRSEDLVRASELLSPSPDGHFLRQFGQADRETIDSAWYNPTTPQALTMLNGPLFERVVADGSPLARAAAAGSSSPEAQVRTVYLALLAREPTPDETAAVLAALGGEGPNLWKPLAWSLLNTRQFLFVK